MSQKGHNFCILLYEKTYKSINKLKREKYKGDTSRYICVSYSLFLPELMLVQCATTIVMIYLSAVFAFLWFLI